MAVSVVSVDIGGTFTDIVVQEGGVITGYFKVPTTPRNPEEAASNGIRKYTSARPSEIVHATTIATNALLGQYGLELPDVALITTEGFRDVLEIGRQNRPKLYDLFFRKPNVIVPRSLRYTVKERTDSKGTVIMKPELSEIRNALNEISGKGIRSAAVSFINSYLNPENEKEAGNILSGSIEYLSLSSAIAPEQREYERTSTAVVNVALMPIVSRYIRNMEKSLEEFGSPSLSIMASSGGLVSPKEVYARPVQILESGPAAGVIASAEVSRIIGAGDVISFDMGGTTAKAGTVVNGKVSVTSEYEVGGESHHGRITRGSGYPVRFPFVDLAEVSAGGGTVIWRDRAGALRIGPMSSGAEPGPICYGRGGKEPTITDANLVLGIIGEEILGGEMKLDRQAAMEGFSRLGDPFEVAEAALNLADMEMARAIRIVTVERGLDPSEFTMMAFGGAGPQHAARIASELGIGSVVIPPRPGVFSALGLLYSDWKYERRSSFPVDIDAEISRLESDLTSVHPSSEFVRYADCRYRGQGSELTVPVESPERKEIEKSFVSAHQATFGFALDREVEIVTLRVFAVIPREKPAVSPQEHIERETASRDVFVNGRTGAVEVYSRSALRSSSRVQGPCAIDDYDTTVFVPEKWFAEPGKYGEIRLWREG